jgi:1-acyl-sn-glycerol-3-phosphate acyltransferase
MALMRLTRCYPTIKNRELVIDFFKKKKENGKEQNAMFVANHCSWMDIPFLGATMGWRNYKIVSKKELGAVPILGTAIRAGGHIMVDRVDRRSQVRTLKQGIGYLKVRGSFLWYFRMYCALIVSFVVMCWDVYRTQSKHHHSLYFMINLSSECPLLL